MRSQTWQVAAGGLALALIMGVGGLYWSYGARLQDHGVKLMATVTDVHGPANRERIAYQYTVNGITYKADEGTHDAEFSSYDKEVPVYYLPENPAVSHFAPDRYKQRGQIIFLLGLVVIASGVYVLRAKNRRDPTPQPQ